jgi:hypothetical protein
MGFGLSNYPPGVTGNEYEIAGADFEEDLGPDEVCPQCGVAGSLTQEGYRHQVRVYCGAKAGSVPSGGGPEDALTRDCDYDSGWEDPDDYDFDEDAADDRRHGI